MTMDFLVVSISLAQEAGALLHLVDEVPPVLILFRSFPPNLDRPGVKGFHAENLPHFT